MNRIAQHVSAGAAAAFTAAALVGCAAPAGSAGAGATASALAPSTVETTPVADATSAAATGKPAGKPTPTGKPAGKPKPIGKTVPADVSQLKELGIDIGPGVLIDVPDDGVDRYLQITKKGVDFTGTTKTDSTMMSLKPARVASNTEATRNRVVIQPPFWNEDAEGPGYCVADTSGAPLKLELCDPAKSAQVWTVVPAGDSGQFELKGRYGIVRVEDGKITTGETGRTGLATIKFAE